jgi:hypothetical protein
LINLGPCFGQDIRRILVRLVWQHPDGDHTGQMAQRNAVAQIANSYDMDSVPKQVSGFAAEWLLVNVGGATVPQTGSFFRRLAICGGHCTVAEGITQDTIQAFRTRAVMNAGCVRAAICKSRHSILWPNLITEPIAATDLVCWQTYVDGQDYVTADMMVMPSPVDRNGLREDSYFDHFHVVSSADPEIWAPACCGNPLP